MLIENLNNKNFILFCAKYYDNPTLNSDEFFEDLSRIKYIKKLLTRYVETGEFKERLILNHIIILCNCFGPEILNKIMYLKLKEQFSLIKPFMVYLNIMAPIIYNVGEEDIIYTDNILMDSGVIAELRKSL